MANDDERRHTAKRADCVIKSCWCYRIKNNIPRNEKSSEGEKW